MSFLQKVPNEYFCIYEGFTEEISCKPLDFCGNEQIVSYRPNMDLPDSYSNWVSQFGLECSAKSTIGFLGSAYFIGWITTLTFLPRLSDLYGRQKLIKCGNLVQLIGYTVIITTNSFTVLVCSLILMGTMATIRTQVSIVNLYENLKRPHYTIVYAVAALFEGLMGVLASLYFMLISKDYRGLILFGFTMHLVGVILSLFIYESPRYLVKSDQLEQA